MRKLEVFLSYLCGEFNNDDQVNKEIEEGEIKHPKAKHITGICNDKIKNLPDDFKGFLLLKKAIISKVNLKIYYHTYFIYRR